MNILNKDSNISTDHPLETTFSSDFESGSMGKIVQVGERAWDFYLADDNDDTSLPDEYRTWWYISANNIPVDVPVTITIKNRGWPFHYVPVYSYDQKNWLRLEENDVTLNTNNEIVINTVFSNEKVWLARFYPYTLTDLETYIADVGGRPHIEIHIPGFSQQNRPIYLIKLTNFDVPAHSKKRVLIHTRTHPAEIPGSFVVEGLVDTLLNGTSNMLEILNTHEFHIFPMHNVDGVVVGNYRTTPNSENLEVLWKRNPNNPLELEDNVPVEVKILHDYAKTLMSDGGPPVSIALNVHASNSEPDTRAFFFPHFGPTNLGYADIEADLWSKQLFYIKVLAARYGPDKFEPLPDDGGSDFVDNAYPESWWWANFKNTVMAMTMELTYDKAGYPERIRPADMRRLGAVSVPAIRDYLKAHATGEYSATSYSLLEKEKASVLQYPELYPPTDKNEGKQ